MKVSEMDGNKTYKCFWYDCSYTGWCAKRILSRLPWMVDLDIWEEEKCLT